MRPWVQFQQIHIGERFTFAEGWPPRVADAPEVFIKVSATKYETDAGRRFVSSPNTAVFVHYTQIGA